MVRVRAAHTLAPEPTALSPRARVCRRRYQKRLWVCREKAANRIQSAARPMNLWPSEMLSLALMMWSRIAKFRQCQRKGQPPPVYLKYVPQWHEWETNAIQKQLRGEVANELHGPSLLRRLLRKWRTLPAVQQREAEMERAAEEMLLSLYGGNTVRRWKGLVEWRRAHRGFFKLLLSAWRHWAVAHKHASDLAFAAASRHRLTCMAQHFEVIQQHTAYRRRMNGACTLTLQGAMGEARGAEARRAAYMMYDEESKARAVQCFSAWRSLIGGSNALGRFNRHLVEEHGRRLKQLMMARWLLATRAAKSTEGADQRVYATRWQEAAGAFANPIDHDVVESLRKEALKVSKTDLKARMAVLHPPPPKPSKAAGRSVSPPGKSKSGPASVGSSSALPLAAGPAGRATASILYVTAPDGTAAAAEAPAEDEWPELSTEAGRKGHMPSFLLWQALAALAPTVLAERRRQSALAVHVRMREKRASAVAALPAFHIRRSMLLGMTELAHSLAADRMRSAGRRDDKLLLLHTGEEHAVNIHRINDRFTLQSRSTRLQGMLDGVPGSAVGPDDGGAGRPRSGGKKGGAKSARSAKGKGGRPGSGGDKRSRTPPPLPVRPHTSPDGDNEFMLDDDDASDPYARLPPSVPRSCRGRERPPALPILPWELSEDDRLALEEAAAGPGADVGDDKVAALSALRALASEAIIDSDGSLLGVEEEVFNEAMKEAMEEGVEGQEMSTSGMLSMASAFGDASGYTHKPAPHTNLNPTHNHSLTPS